MVVQTRIHDKLANELSPTTLTVDNESHMHSVPRGSETHFKVTVVSDRFEGLGRVDRHKLVYSILKEELASGVHALTITSRTPAEWAADATASVSPPCLGGSKPAAG
jgi:stress-induced morphogen